MQNLVNPFQVTSTDDGWKVTGEIDMSSSSALSDAFGNYNGNGSSGGVVVDVDEVTFIDSSGLRVLVDLVNRVDPGRVTLLNTPSSVRRLLELTGLSPMFCFDGLVHD